MSFTSFADKPLRTREQVAAEVHQVSLSMELDELATVIALMTISTEVGADDDNGDRQWWCPWNAADPESQKYPHDSQSDDSRSCGYFQQQKGPAGQLWWGTTEDEMTLATAAHTFLDRLPNDYIRAANKPAIAGQMAQQVQQSSFPLRYAAKWEEAWSVLRRALSTQPTGGSVPATGFTGDPVWLEDVLRADLGDRLIVEDGWAERGVGGSMADIWGVMIHHTANRNETVAAIRDGVDQGPPNGFLPGPLSQCLIKPDGTCHLVAVGPCNHAGPRDNGGMGPINGNQRLIGFECAYDGTGPWPQKQVITMRDATAAVLRRLGHRGDRCIGHKEYAPSRKVDPGNMSMPWFRDEVNKDLDGFVFPGEAVITVPPSPDYDKETWDQMRIEWPQLGNQTLVNANAQMRDKVCGTSDYADWKAGKP